MFPFPVPVLVLTKISALIFPEVMIDKDNRVRTSSMEVTSDIGASLPSYIMSH